MNKSKLKIMSSIRRAKSCGDPYIDGMVAYRDGVLRTWAPDNEPDVWLVGWDDAAAGEPLPTADEYRDYGRLLAKVNAGRAV